MSTALRLGLYYAALFAGSGASGPYAAVWFRDQGLSGAAIGLILAAPLVLFVMPTIYGVLGRGRGANRMISQ